MTSSACTVTTGFPIGRSQGQSSFDSSPGLIAAYHVLHRLITPRHPPCTLNSLITFIAGPASRNKSRKTKTRNKYSKPLPALIRSCVKRDRLVLPACLSCRTIGEPQSLLPICGCQKAVLEILFQAQILSTRLVQSLFVSNVFMTRKAFLG